MKAFQTLVTCAVLLFSINTISAQYGGNGYNNGYGGGYGNGRNQMNSGMSHDSSRDKPREIPVEETVGKIMSKLKPAIDLDELQEIAISNIFTESIKSETAIIKGQTSQDDKIKEFQALSEVTDRKVKELLNSDQKEKYIAFVEESKNPKKSKKNK